VARGRRAPPRWCAATQYVLSAFLSGTVSYSERGSTRLLRRIIGSCFVLCCFSLLLLSLLSSLLFSSPFVHVYRPGVCSLLWSIPLVFVPSYFLSLFFTLHYTFTLFFFRHLFPYMSVQRELRYRPCFDSFRSFSGVFFSKWTDTEKDGYVTIRMLNVSDSTRSSAYGLST